MSAEVIRQRQLNKDWFTKLKAKDNFGCIAENPNTFLDSLEDINKNNLRIFLDRADKVLSKCGFETNAFAVGSTVRRAVLEGGIGGRMPSDIDVHFFVANPDDAKHVATLLRAGWQSSEQIEELNGSVRGEGYFGGDYNYWIPYEGGYVVNKGGLRFDVRFPQPQDPDPSTHPELLLRGPGNPLVFLGIKGRDDPKLREKSKKWLDKNVIPRIELTSK